ncbi:MAG: glycosyltransferase family 2 protein [Chloroflexia bacterium]|nr:glycosyltransferase family 2 protein [Chloroflexia bacterium]
MPDPVLGVIVVSYNTADLLRDCLLSLQRCSLPLHIVVVDNASSDGSAAMVRSNFPLVRVIANTENRGFAAATNQGLRALPAGTDYALLLNPDSTVRPGALETLVDFMQRHPRVGAAGPRLLNPDGSLQENAFTFPTLLMGFLDFFPLHGRIYHSRLNGRYYPQMRGQRPFPIDHPLGACLLLRSSALDQVGLLDEGYFIYVEEVDLCYRLKQAGWQVYHVPGAQVVHHGGQSTRQIPNRMFIELHRSRWRFFRRYYSPAFCWAHRLITHLGLARRAWQDRRALQRGQLGAAALAERLAAYQQVHDLGRKKEECKEQGPWD